MIDFATIEAAIKVYAEGASGLHAQWINAPQVQITADAYVQLDPSGPIVPVGKDWITFAEGSTPETLVPTVQGLRSMKYTIRVISRNQKPATSARYVLEVMRSRLRQPAYLSALQAAGLALASIGPSAVYDSKNGSDRMVSIGAFEIEFSCVSSDTAPMAAEIGTIGHVAVTSDLQAGTRTIDEP